MTWNIEGLESMVKGMPENILNSDILVLTETFSRKETYLPGYYGFHVLATQGEMGRPKGGISCFIKPSLAPCATTHRSCNILAIKTCSVYIICVYFQPNFSEQYIVEAISEVLKTVPKNVAVILAGDLNCRTDKVTQKSTMVLEYLKTEGLILMNNPKYPTYVCHNGASTIDLIFVNSKLKRTSIEIITTSASSPLRKHFPVKATLSLAEPLGKVENRNNRKPQRYLERALLQCQTIEIAEVQHLALEGRINTAATLINKIVKEAQIATKVSSRRARPWFDKVCYKKKASVIALPTHVPEKNIKHLLQRKRQIM